MDALLCQMTKRRIWLHVTIITVIILAGTQTALAEGSRDLTTDPVTGLGNGGDRPYTEWDNKVSAGLERKTLLSVYVNAGEQINLGSSTFASFDDPQDILWRSPTGIDDGSCDVIDGGVGHIGTVAQERAGPAPNPGGYMPCQFNATETGIYEVEFRAPLELSGPNDNPPDIGVDAAFPTGGGTFATVAAWDITVFAIPGDATSEVQGRVYTTLLALNMGDNNQALNSTVFILTQDGYQYQVNLNGLDPFGFVFFSNTKGPRDDTTNAPLYQSIQLEGGNTVQALPADVSILSPIAPDVPATNDFTHKIFFNQPDPNLPLTAASPSGNTWLLQPPIPPAVPTNLRFEGVEASTPGFINIDQGGEFIFEPNGVGAWEIGVDLTGDGDFNDPEDRVFRGVAFPGDTEIRVFWDGNDGLGNDIQTGTTSYAAEIRTYAGEVHFPFTDPEANVNGLIIERLVDPGTTVNAPDPFTIYYDDAYNYDGTNNYDNSLCAAVGDAPPAPLLTAAVPGTPPGCYGAPFGARDTSVDGVNSVGGAHAWGLDAAGLGFGDQRVIETWTRYPSDLIQIANNIQAPEIDLVMEKTVNPSPAVRGNALNFTLRVTNNGPNDAVNARVTDTFSPDLLNVTWTCTANGTNPATGTNAACGAANGAGDIDERVTVPVGGEILYNITATVSDTATSPLTNTACTERPPDTNEPDTGNNCDTVDVPVEDPPPGQPNLVINKDNGVDFVSSNGEQVAYAITFSNTGNADAVQVVITDTLPAGADFVSCDNGCTVTSAPGVDPVVVQWPAIARLAPNAGDTYSLTVNLPAIDPPNVHLNRVEASYTDDNNNTYPNPSDTDTDQVRVDPTDTPDAPTDTPTGTPPTPTNTPTGTLTVTPETPIDTPTDTPVGTPPDVPTVTEPIPGTPVETPTPGDPELTPEVTPTPSDPVIDKAVQPPFAQEGDLVDWVITVTNPNADQPLKDITVIDELPIGLEIIEVLADDGKIRIEGQRVQVDMLELDPGAVMTITVRVRVREDITTFELQNRALMITPNISARSTATLIIAEDQVSTGETPLWADLLRQSLPLVLIGGLLLLTLLLGERGKQR